MMPDLGKYALEVNSSYVLSLLALAVIIGLYAKRSRSRKTRFGGDGGCSRCVSCFWHCRL